VIAVVLAVLLASPEPAPTPRLRTRSHTVVGSVVAGEPGRLTLRTPEGALEGFPVSADLRVTRGGRVARLADLVAGESVIVTCEDDAAGVHKPRSVRILRSLPAPTPAR
jgi:hypothetical protein